MLRAAAWGLQAAMRISIPADFFVQTNSRLAQIKKAPKLPSEPFKQPTLQPVYLNFLCLWQNRAGFDFHAGSHC